MKIKIKPFSVNKAWKGKRYRTDEYKAFAEELFYLLPKTLKIPEGKLQAWYVWGFSNSNADNDNPIKPFQDVLQTKYNFNDKRIVRTLVDQIPVKKGEEFIAFKILGINDRFIGKFSKSALDS